MGKTDWIQSAGRSYRKAAEARWISELACTCAHTQSDKMVTVAFVVVFDGNANVWDWACKI